MDDAETSRLNNIRWRIKNEQVSPHGVSAEDVTWMVNKLYRLHSTILALDPRNVVGDAKKWVTVEPNLRLSGDRWDVLLIGPDENGEPDPDRFVVLARAAGEEGARCLADHIVDMLGDIIGRTAMGSGQ